MGSAARGAYERSGADAYLPLGGGVGTAAGAGTAALALGGGLAYTKYASRDRQLGYIAENAGADVEETEAGKKRIRAIANEIKVPMDMAIEAMGTLAATGLSWQQSLDRLRTVLKTTMATGASPSDIASTVFNIGDKMAVSNKDMPTALDYVAGGGDVGQFETKDMARYLPSLLAQGRIAGYEGLPGLRRLIAMAQIVRADTGDSASAATNLENILFKYNSPETEKNFADHGIDLRGELAAGRKRGQDPMVTLRNLTEQATGGDDTKINTIFRDAQAYKAMVSIANAIDSGKLDKVEAEIGASEGTVERKHSRFAQDAQAGVDRFGNAVDNVTQKTGKLVDTLGGTTLIENAGRNMDNLVEKPQQGLLEMTPQGMAAHWLLDQLGLLPKGGGRKDKPEKTGAGVSQQDPFPTTAPIPTPRPDGAAAAKKSMEGFNRELEKGGKQAEGEAWSIRDTLMGILGFTAKPTIAPTYRDPGGPGASPAEGRSKAGSDKQSSLAPQQGAVKLTQHITSPNPAAAARKAQREQNRSVRHAQARALSDLGTKWA